MLPKVIKTLGAMVGGANLIFGKKEVLGATHWVGAVKRNAEGSYMQLHICFDPAIGLDYGPFAAI